MSNPLIVIGRLVFELTCPACPEQYDVWLGERQERVAYVRLRHGHLTVEMPDAGDQLVWRNDAPNNGWDEWTGNFLDDEQRSAALAFIAGMIEGLLADR